MITNLLETLLNPKSCYLCNEIGFNLCPKCSKTLPLNEQALCLICDNPTSNGQIHKFCKETTFTNLYPEKYIAPFLYDGVVKKFIIRAKYSRFELKLLDPLILHPFSTKKLGEIEKPFVIVPVPMTKKRFNRRKINQSLYISEQLSVFLKADVVDILSKKSGLHSQRGLDRALRIENIKANIEIKVDPKGLNILLVDDVATTGATLLECTKVLKQSGANKVFCYTIAKDLRYN